MRTWLGVSVVIWTVNPLLSLAEVPGDNLSSTIGWNLQRNVYNQILAKERALAPNCKRPHILRAMVSGSPKTLNRGNRMGFAKMQWDERWMVDRCGISMFIWCTTICAGPLGTSRLSRLGSRIRVSHPQME